MAEQLVPSGEDVPDLQADPDAPALAEAPDGVAGPPGVAGPHGAAGPPDAELSQTEPRRAPPQGTGWTRGETGPGVASDGDDAGAEWPEPHAARLLVGHQEHEGDHPGCARRTWPQGSLEAAKAAWRAAAAATADPRWARPGPAAGRLAWDVDPETAPYADAAQGFPTAMDRPRSPDTRLLGGRGAAVAVGGAATMAVTTPTRSGRWPWDRMASALPAALAAAGALLTMISSTMTWATVRAFGLLEYSVAGLDDDQHGRLTLSLGILAALAAAGLAARPRGHAGRLVAGLAGVAGLATVLVALVDIGYLRGGGLLAGSGIQATTAIGPGLWLVLVGGLLGIAAALLARPGAEHADGPSRGARGGDRGARGGDHRGLWRSRRPGTGPRPRTGGPLAAGWRPAARDADDGHDGGHDGDHGSDHGSDRDGFPGGRRTLRRPG